MIQMKHLIYTIIFYSTISLSAIDMNSTAKIIEEATKATKGLQEDFSQLIEPKEANSTTMENNNITLQKIIIKDTVEDEVIEENITIEKSIVIEDSNRTIQEEQIITKDRIEEPKELTIEEINETIQERLEKVPQTSDNNITISKSNITTSTEINSTAEENQTVELESITEDEEELSSKKGMVIFKTKFKAVCKMTGDEFAKNYTQEDWDDIYDNDEFEKVVYEICPEMKGRYDKKWTKDLYHFSLKYASDSDEIPEC